jgi:membrane associated rhomboid family serine protease
MAYRRDGMQARAATLGTFVAILWIVRLLDAILPGHAVYGIVPRTSIGLQGIVTAPFLHASWGHLLANTIPLVIFGSLVLLRGRAEFLFVVVASALVAGAGTWLFGRPNTHHIGASGVVFGLFGYLVSRTIFDRRWSSLLIALVVGFLYGTAMISGLVPKTGISWTAHCFGFIGGVIAARMSSRA